MSLRETEGAQRKTQETVVVERLCGRQEHGRGEGKREGGARTRQRQRQEGVVEGEAVPSESERM
eukprot:47815-Pleurochrysis_carterae.AAC.1